MPFRSVVLSAVVCFAATAAFAAVVVPADITAEAQQPGGAHVQWNASGHGPDDFNGRPQTSATCSPESSSLFPLGSTTVTCTGSDQSSGTFTVTVVDTTGPSLSLPRDFAVAATGNSGAVVTWNTSANDLVDGSLAVTCSPASGSTFPTGTTNITCSATDSRNNAASGGFAATVTEPPPPPPPPPPTEQEITVEATGPNGAVVTFPNTGNGIGDDENGRPLGSCSIPSGALFPLGTTIVTCTNATLKIHVVDTTAPALHLPDEVRASTNASGATVTFSATANDIVDGNVAVTCTPVSGSFFAAGTTTVNCSAADSRSNAANGSFAVVVTQDTPPPPPADVEITAEATGPNGAAVTYPDTAGTGDDHNGRPLGSCSIPSGSLFPLGTTIVTCTNATLKIHVVDTTAPELTLPGNITRPATSADGAVVTFSAFGHDLVDGSVTVTCAPASGSTFPIGTTAVHCSASDSRSNSASGSFVVEVTDDAPADNEAPDILSISASPNVLHPPNGSLREVTLTVEVHDAIDPHPTVSIFDVTSDETITGADWLVTGPLTVKLRATRDGNGDGRVYTIFVEAIDAAGNRSVASVTVTVPHDQGNASPVTSQPPPAKKRSVRG